jgi:hypothetical protein
MTARAICKVTVELISAFGVLSAYADPPTITKSSSSAKFDAPSEVKAYYQKLLQTDANAKRQFETLARKSKLYGDVHFGPSEPQVVYWFPKEDSWDENGFRYDQRFLVIQPLAFGRPKQEDYDLAIVSEFHVIHEGKTHLNPKDRDADFVLDSNKITITFLGFRRFELRPLNTK